MIWCIISSEVQKGIIHGVLSRVARVDGTYTYSMTAHCWCGQVKVGFDVCNKMNLY
jgi:hypothetical protein